MTAMSSQLGRVEFFDTTLRDGLQGEPVCLSLDERLELFDLLEDTGLDYIETGFPAASEIDFELTKTLTARERTCKLSMLARPTDRDLRRTADAIVNPDGVQVQLMFTGSEIHLERKRKMTFAAYVEEMERAIDLCKRYGIQDITAGFEDASRGSLDFLQRCIEICITRGATTLAIPDTLGAFIPEECAEYVSRIRDFVGGAAKLAIHVHNDMGLATANSLAAIKAGADIFQGTIGGIGERAGNAPIEEVACALHYKPKYYGKQCGIRLDKLVPVFERMRELMELPISSSKPIFGANAFASYAGIHIDGMKKDRSTYEFVEPEVFGRHWQFLINGSLGRTLVVDKFEALNLTPTDELVDKVFSAIKASNRPAQYNDPELFLSLHTQLMANPERCG